MDEKNTFTVMDENGKEVSCEVLFTFDSEETKNNYIVYNVKIIIFWKLFIFKFRDHVAWQFKPYKNLLKWEANIFLHLIKHEKF